MSTSHASSKLTRHAMCKPVLCATRASLVHWAWPSPPRAMHHPHPLAVLRVLQTPSTWVHALCVWRCWTKARGLSGPVPAVFSSAHSVMAKSVKPGSVVRTGCALDAASHTSTRLLVHRHLPIVNTSEQPTSHRPKHLQTSRQHLPRLQRQLPRGTRPPQRRLRQLPRHQPSQRPQRQRLQRQHLPRRPPRPPKPLQRSRLQRPMQCRQRHL